MLSEFGVAKRLSNIPITSCIAGYVSRNLIKARECRDCQRLLFSNQEPLNVIMENNDASDATMFIDAIRRVEKVKPSELVYIVCTHASDIFKSIKNNDKLRYKLLSSVN